MLIFTNTGVYWKCQSEFQPRVMAKDELIQGWGVFDDSRTDILNCPSPEDVLSIWMEVVDQYTSRHLSHKEDKLPALAAAAKLFSEKLQSEYLAGIWKRGLLLGLAWEKENTSAPQKRPTPSTCPTWSWASVSSPVHHLLSDSAYAKHEAEVLECSTTLEYCSLK